MNRQPQTSRQKAPGPRAPAAVSLILSICLGLLVAGCGNRGPLYLPDAAEAAEVSPETVPEPVDPPAGTSIAPAAGTDTTRDADPDEEVDDEDDPAGPRGA